MSKNTFLRKYGEATTIPFTLFEVDGVNFRTDAVHAAGDSFITKDEGVEANTTSGFADEGSGYSLALSATELEAARVHGFLVDQSGTKVWLDTDFIIETYGHASAQHAFDLGTAFKNQVTQAKSGGGTHDLSEILGAIVAGTAGITSDGGKTFKGLDKTTTKVAATTDGSGNRTAMTYTDLDT